MVSAEELDVAFLSTDALCFASFLGRVLIPIVAAVSVLIPKLVWRPRSIAILFAPIATQQAFTTAQNCASTVQ